MKMNSAAAATSGISSGRAISVRRMRGEAGGLAQAEREGQRQGQAGDDRAGGVDDIVGDRFGEVRVGEQAGVVADAGGGLRLERADGQRGQQDLEHRPVGEGEQEDGRGREQGGGEQGGARSGAASRGDGGARDGADCVRGTAHGGHWVVRAAG